MYTTPCNPSASWYNQDSKPGYGIREAADIIGIDRGYLSRIEHGLRCPSPEVAERIAELYRLPIAVTDRLMAAAALTRAYGRSIGVR